jgi:hypothetical protein
LFFEIDHEANMLMVDTDLPPNHGNKVKPYWQRKEKRDSSIRKDHDVNNENEDTRGVENGQENTKKVNHKENGTEPY